WLAIAVAVIIGASSLFWSSPYSFFNWPSPIYRGAALAFVASAAFAQIYRYVHLSNPAQKRQIKWLMYGGAVGLVVQALNVAGRPDPLAERVALPVSGISSLILPIA